MTDIPSLLREGYALARGFRSELATAAANHAMKPEHPLTAHAIRAEEMQRLMDRLTQYISNAQAALGSRADWALVPMEPTPEMLDAVADNDLNGDREWCATVYRGMVKARP